MPLIKQSVPTAATSEPLATPGLLCLFHVPIPDISYKWHHTMYDLLCLGSFT